MCKKLSLWLLGLMLTATSIAFGQVTASSSLQGSVSDKTGAAVVGAEVTVTSVATGASRTVKTGSDGNYRVDPLSVGYYNVSVSMTGFDTAKAQRVQTLVGATTTQNFSLNVGSTTESVEVSAEAPLIDSLKTDVSENITPRQVQDLPLIGRDVANLAYLAPGVKAADSYDPTKNRYAILSVNGEGGRNVNVTVNGVDNKDNTVGGPVMQLPLEAVQEFAISTQRFSAANGRSEGAAINMITKSGSNNYHGSIFSFFRDQTFNADQHPQPDQTANPPYSRQQFGGSVGGPFVKDKLFGFFAYERQREHTSLQESGTTFNELTLAEPLGAKPLAVVPTPFFETRYNGRADYIINSRNTAYVTYNSQGNNSENDQSDGFQDQTAGNFTTNQIQLANFTLNSTLSNTTVNTATFGFQYWNNVIDSKIRTPLITFPGGGSANCGNGGSCFGTNANVPQQSFQRKWQFKDDISKSWNNHTFKAGVDYIFNPTLGGYFEFNDTLEVDFAADPSQILADKATYPQGFASAGAISGLSISNGDPTTTVPGGTKQFGTYFQDDWKVSRRLTLNLGLRWDKDFNFVGGSAVHDSRTYQELVAISNVSPLAKQFTYKQPGDDNRDFSPRVGFAYDLTGGGRHVLRGGFGLYYGDIFQNIPLFMEQMHNATIFQTQFSLSNPTDVVPGTNIQLQNYRYGVDPLPTVGPPSAQLAPGATGRLMDPLYRNPITEEMNIGYSWALTNSSVLEAEYVHVLGLHENKTINIDPSLPINGDPSQGFAHPLSAAFAAAKLPVLGSVRDEQSIGRSRYDGMNLSYRQQMVRHVSLIANYTLARAFAYGNTGTSFRNYPRDPRNPFSPFEYGPTFNDERHHLTLSAITNLPWGIQFAPILQAGSARPYNAAAPTDTLGFGSGEDNRAVVVPNNSPTTYMTGAAGRTCYFAGQCHLVPFNNLRGSPFFQLDTRLSKNFKLGEKASLQLIAQAFNLTNRANYGNDVNTNVNGVDAVTGKNNFGTPAGFINPTSTNIPRSLAGEFGFRLSF
jgi:outer membrane receptor protein involved in Fe transport